MLLSGVASVALERTESQLEEVWVLEKHLSYVHLQVFYLLLS